MMRQVSGSTDADDQLGAVVLEERLELGGQQIDRAAHDVAMRVGAPRDAGAGASAAATTSAATMDAFRMLIY